MSQYRIRFQYQVLIDAATKHDALKIVLDTMKKTPDVFISSVEDGTQIGKKSLWRLFFFL